MGEVVDFATEANRLHADELRASWQHRALVAATAQISSTIARPRDVMGMCIISILAHNFDDAMPVLLRLAGFHGVGGPCLYSAARIAKNGAIMADLIRRNGRRIDRQALFRNSTHMEGAFRLFADRLRFNDAERVELFIALRNWVVADYRLDPTMDPADPDAKRLTVN